MYMGYLSYQFRSRTEGESWNDDKHIWKDSSTNVVADDRNGLVALVKRKIEIQLTLPNTQYRSHSIIMGEVAEKFNVVIKIELEPPTPTLEL